MFVNPATVPVKNRNSTKMLLKVGAILRSFVKFNVDKFLQFNVDVTDNVISIYKISDMPPKVIFAITIGTSFEVVCYNQSKLTIV